MSRRPNLPALALLAALAAALTLGFSLPGEFERLLQAGNKSYGKGQFKKAAAAYDKAVEEQPARPDALFNRGAARYRLEDVEHSLADFSAAARGAEDQLAVFSQYNAGNCLYRMQKLDEAVARYKRALTLDPTDQWAKHNLEMALKKQQEQQQQKKREKDQQKSKDSKKQDEQQKGQQPDDKDEQQDKQQEQQQDDAKQQEDKDKQQQDAQEQDSDAQQDGDDEKRPPEQREGAAGKDATDPKDAQPLTPEQAAQLLGALAQEDANLQRIIRRAPLTQRRPTDKDW